MAQKPNYLVWALVAFVAYMLFSGNLAGFIPDKEPATPVSTDYTKGACPVDGITFSTSMVRRGKEGTSLSTVAYNYFILTDKIGTKAGNAETTVPTFYDLQIMFCENSTTYYTQVEDLNTKCKNPFNKGMTMAMADSDVNLYVKNEDGTVNSASNNQSVVADGTFEVLAYFKAGPDTYFGNPDSDCKNIAVVEYDMTYFKNVEGADAATVPYGAFSYTNTNYDGANAFYIPKSDGDDKGQKEISFTLEATSSEPTHTNPPILHIYDCDIDKDEDSLELIEGVMDEDKNIMSLQHQSITISIK